jgi:hypothetical protein
MVLVFSRLAGDWYYFLPLPAWTNCLRCQVQRDFNIVLVPMVTSICFYNLWYVYIDWLFYLIIIFWKQIKTWKFQLYKKEAAIILWHWTLTYKKFLGEMNICSF